ncbi:hypothetical protein OHA77_34000 [Streptosporangium sp. NBC_01639]|nr:hypothetical protein [Streptosporangium sp. NBC_01756]WSC87718.1 hypothetical protein OIE48_05760 [Streptosporangium sp. NBC_01756]WTD53603.1 hypothetical protein OHA77_34000 [Streptosporangium sp. NBC_01639]
MICEQCKDRRHAECRGGSWCDCQHQEAVRPAESPLDWPRQG